MYLDLINIKYKKYQLWDPSKLSLLTFFSSILVECVVAWMHGVGTSILYCLMFDLVISVVFTQDYLMFLEQ